MANPSAPEALIIPEGAQFEAKPQGWVVSNVGDVRLLGAPNLTLERVRSEQGDVTLAASNALTLERLEAPEGTITISGPITVHSIYAKTVKFTGGQLSVRSLVAEDVIILSGEQLQADMIVAPTVELNKDTRGRATVIESKNELGATQLKGCFRMDDYLELFPNGQEQVNSYADVKSRLDRWDDAEAAPSAPAEAEAEPIEAVEVLGQPIGTQDGMDERVDEILMAPEDEDAAIEVLEAVEDDDLYDELNACMGKVLSCYTDMEVPPQVSKIDHLIQSRQFDNLRGQVNNLYSELIRHHKKEKLPFANAVASSIKDIRTLLSDD